MADDDLDIVSTVTDTFTDSGSDGDSFVETTSKGWLTRLGESRIGIKGFCTWGLARRSLPELRAHKLDLLREHFGLKCSKPHSASGDVEATVDLLVRVLFPRLIELGYNDFNGVAAFSQLRPISLCHYLVQGQSYEDAVAKIEADRKQTREQVLAAKKAERARLDELQSILNAIGSHQIYVPEQLVHLGFMEEMPSVTFDGRCFQFTGRMNWGQRSKAVAEIMK